MSGVTGTWTEDRPTRADMVELSPLTDETELLPGDEVWIGYDLYQLGDYFIAWQVGEIEKQLEADGRFAVMSYIYDEPNKTLTLKCRVRNADEIPAKVYYASPFTLGLLVGLVWAVACFFCYAAGDRIRAWRMRTAVVSVLEDPSFPAEKKQAILDAMSQGTAGGTGVTDAIAGVGSGLVLVALAALALMLFGGRK
jgi:hypothetical protein